MKRSSMWGKLVVIFIAAAIAMPIGAAAEEDGVKPLGADLIQAASDVEKGDSVLVPPQLKAGGDASFQNGVKFSGEGEPAAEEGEQPLQGGGCSDPPFQAKINWPSFSANLPEGKVPTCEEADPPQQEEEPPPPPPIVVIDDGGVADDANDLLEETDEDATPTLPVEISAIFEEAPWHWTGSGGCATLMPGVPASAGSALTFLLWLAPLAAIRRGNKRASYKEGGAKERIMKNLFVRTLIAVFALAVPAMLAGCGDSSELAGFSSGPPPEEEPLSPVAPESEGEAAEAPDGSEAAAEPSEAADDGAKQGQEVEVEITAVVQGAPTASGGRLVEIAWSLKNVSGAYISLMPSSSFVKLVPSSFFSHAAFIGSSGKPHLGTKSIKGKSWQMIAKDLLDDPLAEFDQLDASVVEKIGKDTEGHPFSYCMESTIFSTKSCYKIMSTSGPNVFRVFFPLRKGETSRAGTWIFEISEGQEALPVLYRDALKGKIHWMKVEIQ